jgi:hypothetical protein
MVVSREFLSEVRESEDLERRRVKITEGRSSGEDCGHRSRGGYVSVYHSFQRRNYPEGRGSATSKLSKPEEQTIVHFRGEAIWEENLFDVSTSEDTRSCVM